LLAKPLGKLLALQKLSLICKIAIILFLYNCSLCFRECDFLCCSRWFLTRFSGHNFHWKGAKLLAEPLGQLAALQELHLFGTKPDLFDLY
jgi:hypothetical protein